MVVYCMCGDVTGVILWCIVCGVMSQELYGGVLYVGDDVTGVIWWCIICGDDVTAVIWWRIFCVALLPNSAPHTHTHTQHNTTHHIAYTLD